MSDALICLEMGNVFQEEGNHPAAADAYKRAMDIDPTFARSYYCQANLERELGQYDQSQVNYNKAIELDPAVADFYNNRGHLYYEISNPKACEADFLKAVELQPTEGLFLNNLGVLYQCLNRLDEAKTLFEKATALDPNYVSSYVNLGIIYSCLGNQLKAIEFYDKAIALNPTYETAYNSKCLSLLALGQYEKGWKTHEWRWKTNYKPFPKGLPDGELWTGEQQLLGKSILIQSEQGFGDIIQFSRYLPMVEKLGAKIVFRTEKAIIKLMQSLPVDMEMIAMDEIPAPTDYYVPILSLPLIFKTTLENIPNQFPYLFAEKEKGLYWKSRIGQMGNKKLHVGLVWSGAPRPQKLNYRGLNTRRDIPLKLLEPLLKEDMQFFSLQVGAPAQSQLNTLDSQLKENIIDWTSELSDFSDTAALIENLDVVVCVDTSTAHLAGAMDKMVFLLNRKDTCWRWLESGDYSPWYPNIKIFRQPELLQWHDVITSVIAELRKLSSSKITS